MSKSLVSLSSEQTLTFDGVFPEKIDISDYMRMHTNKFKAKRVDYVKSIDNQNTADALGVVPGIIVFILAWLLPILLGASVAAFITIGIVGGLFLGVGAAMLSSVLLYETGILEVFAMRKSKKLFPLDTDFDNLFELEVTGDKKIGQVVVNIKNTLEETTLFSRSFTFSQEVEALDTISEAKDLVLEANSEFKRLYVDQKIEAEGFVDRVVAHGKS